MKKFDIHLSTGTVHVVDLTNENARQGWFMKGLAPTGWICMDGLQNFNMAHVVAIVPHVDGESA